LECNCGTPVE